MAEKQFALSGGRNDEFFADDDPLAELARIVGFEPRPSAPVAPTITRQEPVMEAQSPEFALEDELMREFALYDAPRLDPVNEISLSEPGTGTAEERFSAFEQVSTQAEPQAFAPAAVPDEPIAMAPAREETYPIEALLEAELAGDMPAAEYEELLSDGDERASAMDASQYSQQHANYAAPSDYARQNAYSPVELAPVAEEPHFALEDLADELEQSIADVEPEPVGRVASVGEQPRFRLPLANFNIPTRQPVSQPVSMPTEPAAPPVVPASLDVAPEVPGAREPAVEYAADLPDLDFGLDADQLAAEYMEGVNPTPVVVAPKASVEEHLPDATARADVDALLADVERYSIPVQSAAASERFEPVAELFSPEAAPAIARPVSYVAAPDVAREPALDSGFGDPEFELDLDGIELELSDMSFDEPAAPAPKPVSPIVAAAAPPHSIWEAPIAAAAAAASFRPAPEPARPSYQDNSELFAQPAAAPARRAAAAEASVPLPFDPELIADPEENPEALAELDVPALPVIEKEEPVALQPEYDFDIDAEMANLFEPAPTHESLANAAAAGGPAWAAAAASTAKTPQKSMDEFDEFEKALEEDFRQTLKEPYDNDHNVAKMTLDPALAGVARGRSRSLKGMLLASCLVVVGGVAAFGAYNWLFGASSSLSSNGPVVISADKEPVKVVPEDKGGKTVPNQDKAVYDRVAGASAGDPKQEKLVTSNEEPVDVVQKTLIPDNLPLEGAEDDAGLGSTPVGETEDARLLPSDGEEASAAAKENTPAGVAARKVRSMIVKPDGTIVAREAPAEPVEELAPVAEMPKPGAAEADIVSRGKPALAQSTQQPDEPAVPVTSAKTSATVLRAATSAQAPASDASSEALSDVANSNVGGPAPVRTVKTNTVGDSAPMPAARPAEQPVNVVGTVTDKGNVRDAQAAEPSQQVASVAPGTYFVQVASLPSEAEAQKSYESLSRKFGNVIGGRGVDIKKAEIAGKGTFYRVRIPGGTKDEAAALCEKYRAAGGSCLIAK